MNITYRILFLFFTASVTPLWGMEGNKVETYILYEEIFSEPYLFFVPDKSIEYKKLTISVDIEGYVIIKNDSDIITGNFYNLGDITHSNEAITDIKESLGSGFKNLRHTKVRIKENAQPVSCTYIEGKLNIKKLSSPKQKTELNLENKTVTKPSKEEKNKTQQNHSIEPKRDNNLNNTPLSPKNNKEECIYNNEELINKITNPVLIEIDRNVMNAATYRLVTADLNTLKQALASNRDISDLGTKDTKFMPFYGFDCSQIAYVYKKDYIIHIVLDKNAIFFKSPSWWHPILYGERVPDKLFFIDLDNYCNSYQSEKKFVGDLKKLQYTKNNGSISATLKQETSTSNMYIFNQSKETTILNPLPVLPKDNCAIQGSTSKTSYFKRNVALAGVVILAIGGITAALLLGKQKVITNN